MGAIITCFGNRPSITAAATLAANATLQQQQQSLAAGMMGKREVELLKQDKKLQKLIAGADPEEISGIGAYLLQHLNRDLDKNNYNRVEIAVNIIDLLLENCRKVSSWPLLVQNYFEMVKRLLQSDEPRLETMGTQLFQRHSKLHKDVGEGLAKEYGLIAQKFMTFMTKTNADAKRMNGFTGIKVIGTNLLLIHVSKKSERWAKELFKKMVDFMLVELLYTDEKIEESDALEFVDSDVDFNTLFIAHLRELVLKCLPGNLKILIDPIFKHLTITDSWNLPNDFLTNFFIAIMAETGHEKLDLFVQCLIHHIKYQQHCASTYDLIGMAKLLANFVPLVARPFDQDTKSVKSMRLADNRAQSIKVQKQNFMAILELLQMSMDMSKMRKDIKLISEYQDKLIEAMNKLSLGMPDTMKLQAVISGGGSPLPIMIGDKPFFQSLVQQN